MKRRVLRQKALQSLYQIDVGKADSETAIRNVLEDEADVSEDDVRYLTRLVQGTMGALPEVDQMLETSVEGWKLDRIARVDKNVLRLATYELLYESDVDVATIVNEAVELAKSFSTNDSGRFVNGVLAKLLPAVKERRQ